MCISTGYEVNFVSFNQIQCSSYSSVGIEHKINLLFGGLFSAVILLVIIVILVNFLNKHKNYIHQIFLPVVLIQLLNAILEYSLQKEVYENIAYNTLLIHGILILLFVVVWSFLHKNK